MHPRSSFFGVVSGSVTATGPAVRRRTTVPVWHQVRLACQEYPASQSVCRIVLVLTRGRPSGAERNARCKVVSDQVAVPSRARSGARRNSWRIRSRSSSPYWMAGPPPCRRSSAVSPAVLKRATRWATACRDRRPAMRAAVVNEAPSATARSAFAWATRSARSLPARLVRSTSARSSAVSRRSGSFCRVTPCLPACWFLAPGRGSLLHHPPQTRYIPLQIGHNRAN
jgi:hypothetical protein